MSRGKIIVVEDDRDIREGLCELLTRDGYDVTACGRDRKSTRLNSSHRSQSRMPSSA